MAPLLVTVEFSHLSGRAKDSVQMNFAFTTPSVAYDGAEAQIVVNQLNAFFNLTAAGATKALCKYMSTTMSRATNDMRFKVYDLTGHLNGSNHGSPRQTFFGQLGAADVGQVNLPQEVCCVFSFHADFTGDPEFGPGTRPRMRDRGRIFFGPLHVGVLDQAPGSNRCRMNALIRADGNAAMAALAREPQSAWSVWSRANATIEPVVGGFTDDAPDTQRRRGEDYVLRDSWVA